MVTAYQEFIRSKSHAGSDGGFEPIWIPSQLFDFQRHLVEWATRRGRAALFEGCGLGKTPQQLVWAENVVRHANRPVLVLTPIAVGPQTIREGEKFGVEVRRAAHRGDVRRAGVYVTNYEKLHHFDPDAFAGVVADESGCVKDFDSRRTGDLTAFLRTVPYRLLCSATPAPNDWDELGTAAECLGEMGYQDMLSRFFHKQTSKDSRGWGRLTYRMRAYAERDFWRWVVSWARACRRPSDLGYGDDRYALPELVVRVHEVAALTPRPGHLFDLPAETVQEQAEERRRTLPERCARVAELVADTGESAVCWCNLNDEGDRLERVIPGAVQVSGADREEAKEEAFEGFVRGQIRVLISKPTIAGYGLNWQHCAHQTFFPSHSYEQYHQALHRLWRFGQTRPVRTDIVTTDGAAAVLANLERKARQADRMFARLVELMGDQLEIRPGAAFVNDTEVPAWLSSSRN